VGLTFFDPRAGVRAEFKPASQPEVGLELGSDGPRERAVRDALAGALVFLGLKPVSGAEIRVGGASAGGGAWLQVAPATGNALPDDAALAARGYSPADFRYLCLKTHYRKPLAFSWEALAAARAERGDLGAAARSLADVSLEPSARARAGYLHRFREALSRDLDLPEALATVWDALRPGALSPGSRAALLRETLPALGLYY